MTSGSAALGCKGANKGGPTSADLFNLDTKMDDGIPLSGKVRLMGQDGGDDDHSMQTMCNYPGLFGQNCNYQNGGTGACATGSGTGTYTSLSLTTTICPFGYQL